MPAFTVKIPTDGSVPPCPICGALTVDLEGKPARCSLHDFCPPCGGTTEGFAGPQLCPVHRCPAWRDDRTHCKLARAHDGPHEAWARHPRFWWCSDDEHRCGSFEREPVGRVVELRDEVDEENARHERRPTRPWVKARIVFVTCSTFQAEQNERPEQSTHWWRPFADEGRTWRYAAGGNG